MVDIYPCARYTIHMYGDTKTAYDRLIQEHESPDALLDAIICGDKPIMTTTTETRTDLSRVKALDSRLTDQYNDVLKIESHLTRQLVSFQANKARPGYRWYKYKEAFSAALVEYFLRKYNVTSGTILDPFAGAGTTLFAASAIGLDAEGIELLPVGGEIFRARKQLERDRVGESLDVLRKWIEKRPWKNGQIVERLPSLRITDGAYPTETEKAIGRYIAACRKEGNEAASLLRFALMCILEVISYTRKDGQYLRWDYRSGRRVGKKPFNKGDIRAFDEAISSKLNEIRHDVVHNADSFFTKQTHVGRIHLHEGSCLYIMQTLPDASYDAIMTSPPYCNRYDYTRTYALELALLGVDEEHIRHLRQEMLSCTVENRSKDLLALNPQWTKAVNAADEQDLLQNILKYLDEQKIQGTLNNNSIPRMVRGYFYEMACVIYECARVLKRGGLMFMVNDNVRYAGAPVSVDLILSDIANKLGFIVDKILVLPNGKGNSSQQMGKHGRETLRKCVYVWRMTR